MKIQQLNEQVYIADQINIDDMDCLKGLGIQSIINNRPDNEGDNQPLSEDLSNYAASINLDYYYLPVVSGDYPTNKIKELAELLETARSPTLVFCRTGNRSVHLWALSQTPKFGHQYVLTKAKEIGFKI
jgi:sulfide:quinone oxidoreductase